MGVTETLTHIPGLDRRCMHRSLAAVVYSGGLECNEASNWYPRQVIAKQLFTFHLTMSELR